MSETIVIQIDSKVVFMCTVVMVHETARAPLSGQLTAHARNTIDVASISTDL